MKVSLYYYNLQFIFLIIEYNFIVREIDFYQGSLIFFTSILYSIYYILL